MSSCSICLESFRNPRELPCHHSFCEVCLQEFIDKLAKDGNVATSFNCPNCRTKITPPRTGIPTAEWAKQFPCFPKQSKTTSHIAPLIKRECNPCQYDGKHIDAKKYCTTCKEYLCEECHSFHKRMTLLRNHEVIGLNEIGRMRCNLPQELCPCKWNEKLTYYCKSDEIFCCILCKEEKHKGCKNIKAIADLSSEVKEYGHIHRALKKIDWIRDNLKNVTKLMEENKTSLERERSTGIEAVKKMFTDLKASIEEVEATIIDEMNSKFEQSVISLTQHKDKCSAAIEEVEASTSMLKLAQEENENAQLYLTFHRLQTDMAHYEKGFCHIVADTKTFELGFERNQNMQTFKQNLQKCGEIKYKEYKSAFTPSKWRSLKEQQPIKLKLINPGRRGITDLVELTHDKIVTVHSDNCELIAAGCQFRYPINGAWNVAIIAENEIAVTSVSSTSIHILSVDNRINAGRTISTVGSCYGITYCSTTRELVITTHIPFCKDSVQILTLTGDVVKTIQKDNKGQDIFSGYAEFVAVNKTGGMIYVSDKERGVIGVSRVGDVKFIYKEVKEPRGIDTDRDGNVYVCDSGSHNVLLLTPDGSSARVLICAGNGLDQPWSFFFNKSNDSFIISQKEGRQILTYQMK